MASSLNITICLFCIFYTVLFYCFIFQLCDHVPSCTWILAYSTFQHGMSLKTLYYRLREVDTPVLLVVKDDKGYVSVIERSLHPAAVVNESTDT